MALGGQLNILDLGDQLEDLSPREFEIFRMILDAKTTDEIASAFHVSRKTVANWRHIIPSIGKTSADPSCSI